MADTMQFDLVSPERVLSSVAVTSVQIPGVEGEFTAMPNHAPFLTTLRPGVVRVNAAGGVTEYVVTGGFAEVSQAGATILAEQAVPRSEADTAFIGALQEQAEATLAGAPEESRTAAGQRVRDISTLRAQLLS